MSFLREPIIGGDDNTWGTYLLAQFQATLGDLSCKLENVGGTLYINPGHFGIDDGTNRGIVTVPAAESISLAGTSNETWIAIECAVSGTAHTFTATDIAGATDPTLLPTDFRNSYDGEKGGFYITNNKRCIGLVWKNAGGVLLAVINTVGGREEWWASQIGLHTGTIHEQSGPGKGFVIEIGNWNMNVTGGGSASVTVTNYFGVFYAALQRMNAIVRPDSGALGAGVDIAGELMRFGNNADPNLLSGGWTGIGINAGNTFTTLYIRTGGYYDSANFNDPAYNRGWVTIHMRDF